MIEPSWMTTAKDHGFVSRANPMTTSTCNRSDLAQRQQVRIVGKPLMPDGYAAIVSGQSALVIGPNGAWVIK